MSIETEQFDEWDPAALAAQEELDEVPVKWTLYERGSPGDLYVRTIGDLLAEHTGSRQRYLTVEREQELAAIIQDGLTAQPLLAAVEARLAKTKHPLQRDMKAQAKLQERVRAGREAERIFIECNLRMATYLARLSMNIRPGNGGGDDDEIKPSGERPSRQKPAKRHIFKSDHAGSPGDMTRLRSPYADYDERVQAVNEYLIRTVRNFKPGMVSTSGENAGKTVRFSSFAMVGLRRHLARHIITYEKPGLKIPTHQLEDMRSAYHDNDNDLDLTREQREEYQEWEKLREPVFIDDVVSFGAAAEEIEDDDEVSVLPLAEVVADPDDPPVADLVAERLRKPAIDEMLKTLSEREAGIIRLRYGLSDGIQHTYDAIGRVYDLTRERIRQIESAAMSKLRHPSRSLALRGYVNLETEIEAPPHTLPFPRLKTTRTIGGGAIRLGTETPLYVGEPAGADAPRERWQAYPGEEWDEPVRMTEEQLHEEFQQVATGFKEMLFAAGMYTFQHSFVESGATSEYPKVLVEAINARFKNSLTTEHIQQFWHEGMEDFISHLHEKLAGDVSVDRIVQLLSKLLAERMDDSSRVTLTVPEALQGKLNYVGAWLEHGELIIDGDLGTYAGYRMGGLGVLKVNGSVGNLAAAEAHKMARIEVMGNAGSFLAARAYGSASVHVYGSVGAYCGTRARQQVDIQVLDDAGERLAYMASGGDFIISGVAASVEPAPTFKGTIYSSPDKNKRQ